MNNQEAINCLKKSTIKWHPCDNKTKALNLAIKALEKLNKEDIADFIIECEDYIRIALDNQDREYLEKMINQWIKNG